MTRDQTCDRCRAPGAFVALAAWEARRSTRWSSTVAGTGSRPPSATGGATPRPGGSTTRSWPTRCGPWPTAGWSPATPSPRSAGCSRAAAPRTSRSGDRQRGGATAADHGSVGPPSRSAAAHHAPPGAGQPCPPRRQSRRSAPMRPPRACSTGMASSPAAAWSPKRSPAASPPSTASSVPPRRPVRCDAATSSRAWAPRSSRCPARDRGSVRRSSSGRRARGRTSGCPGCR